MTYDEKALLGMIMILLCLATLFLGHEIAMINHKCDSYKFDKTMRAFAGTEK